jgi:hypothetical protein
MLRRVGPMTTHSPPDGWTGGSKLHLRQLSRHMGIGFLSGSGILFFISRSFLSFFLSFTHSSFLATYRSGVWRLIGAGWGLVKVRSIWERGDMADGRGFVFVFFWHRAWARLLGIFACIGHGQSDRRGFFSIFCHAAIYSWIGGGSCGPSGARLVHPAYRVPDIGGGEGYAIVMICDRRFWWGETRGRDTGHGHLKREKGRTHIFSLHAARLASHVSWVCVIFFPHVGGGAGMDSHLADALRILVSVQRIPHCGWFWDFLGWGVRVVQDGLGGPCPSLWKTMGDRRTGVRPREETYAMVHFLFSRWPRFLAALAGFVPVWDVTKHGMENGRGCLRGRGRGR